MDSDLQHAFYIHEQTNRNLTDFFGRFYTGHDGQSKYDRALRVNARNYFEDANQMRRRIGERRSADGG